MDRTLSGELSFLARHRLAMILDQESPLAKDWRGLADKMEFDYSMIMLLRSKQSPTMSLLEEWERYQGRQATLDNLIQLTESLAHKPALEVLLTAKVDISKKKRVSPFEVVSKCEVESADDQVIMDNYRNNSSIAGQVMPGIADLEKGFYQLSIQKQSIGTPTDDFDRPRALSMKDRQLLDGAKFDVFLSFAEENWEFATEVQHRLCHRAGVSVYVPSDAMMPGKSVGSEIADKIKQGCKKTLVILSPQYLKSPWCKYEASLALHNSPDPQRHTLIPVMYCKCEVPNFISHLYYLDYPRFKDDVNICEERFWARLYRSVKLPEN